MIKMDNLKYVLLALGIVASVVFWHLYITDTLVYVATDDLSQTVLLKLVG